MPKPRFRIPAQARERIYRAAAMFARSCADTMITNLENQLTAELHAAMRQDTVREPAGLSILARPPA